MNMDVTIIARSSYLKLKGHNDQKIVQSHCLRYSLILPFLPVNYNYGDVCISVDDKTNYMYMY